MEVAVIGNIYYEQNRLINKIVSKIFKWKIFPVKMVSMISK